MPKKEKETIGCPGKWDYTYPRVCALPEKLAKSEVPIEAEVEHGYNSPLPFGISIAEYNATGFVRHSKLL